MRLAPIAGYVIISIYFLNHRAASEYRWTLWVATHKSNRWLCSVGSWLNLFSAHVILLWASSPQAEHRREAYWTVEYLWVFTLKIDLLAVGSLTVLQFLSRSLRYELRADSISAWKIVESPNDGGKGSGSELCKSYKQAGIPWSRVQNSVSVGDILGNSCVNSQVAQDVKFHRCR
jgi:hypothetical protein